MLRPKSTSKQSRFSTTLLFLLARCTNQQQSCDCNPVVLSSQVEANEIASVCVTCNSVRGIGVCIVGTHTHSSERRGEVAREATYIFVASGCHKATKAYVARSLSRPEASGMNDATP